MTDPLDLEAIKERAGIGVPYVGTPPPFAPSKDLRALIAEVERLRTDNARLTELLREAAQEREGDIIEKLREWIVANDQGWSEAPFVSSAALLGFLNDLREQRDGS